MYLVLQSTALVVEEDTRVPVLCLRYTILSCAIRILALFLRTCRMSKENQLDRLHPELTKYGTIANIMKSIALRFLTAFVVTTIIILSLSRSDQSSDGFYVLDPHDYRSYFPDEESFQLAKRVAPFIDLPIDDNDKSLEYFHDVQIAFYYRVRSYRKHVVQTPNNDGKMVWVVTEFLPEVGWSGAGNTISAAAGHHILEGRWFHDAPIFLQDYIRFWYLGGQAETDKSITDRWEPSYRAFLHQQSQRELQQPQPQPHLALYTNWIYHAAWQFGKLRDLTLQSTLFVDTFDHAARVFEDIYVNKYLTIGERNRIVWNTTDRLCWAQNDGYDAMEDSVSGPGCRPTIASAMWGEATALVHAGKVLGKSSFVIQKFKDWADLSQDIITQQHWNPTIDSFAVIPPPKTTKSAETKLKNMDLAPGCELNKIRTPNQPVGFRELLAFMPWYYSSLLPLEDPVAVDWARQFRSLLKSSGNEGFSGPWGLRTVQRSSPCYNFTWEHGDCWNGPSWPFETSRVLTAVANLLIDHNDNPSIIKASGMNDKEFQRLFLQYALQHTRTRAVNDTARPLTSGHVFENLHPDEGYWNNRERMYWRNATNKDMGDDYNHSTFLDIIFSSWLGIRVPEQHDSGDATDKSGALPWLVVHPLFSAPYFAADRIPYRGRVLSIVYDPDGSHYSLRKSSSAVVLKGFLILIDGQIVAQRPDIGRLEVPSEPFRRKL